MVTDDNKWSSYDIDYCRALSVAVLGSDKNLRVVPVSWAQRFPSLQSGDIDVIIKATGWTMGRDTELGLQFAGYSTDSRPTTIVSRQSAV